MRVGRLTFQFRFGCRWVSRNSMSQSLNHRSMILTVSGWTPRCKQAMMYSWLNIRASRIPPAQAFVLAILFTSPQRFAGWTQTSSLDNFCLLDCRSVLYFSRSRKLSSMMFVLGTTSVIAGANRYRGLNDRYRGLNDRYRGVRHRTNSATNYCPLPRKSPPLSRGFDLLEKADKVGTHNYE